MASHEEGGNQFPRMEGFTFSVDDSFLDQIDYPVREHFRVNTQIFFVLQALQDGIEDSSYFQLQGGAILDEFCTVSTDSLFRFPDFRQGYFKQGVGGFHDIIQFGNVYVVITSDMRHPVVYLGNHHACGMSCGFRVVGRNSETTITFFVRCAELNDCHVNR